MSTFQENLKKYRERLGITAKDFAAEVGIKYGTYISYETAGKEPKYDTLRKIAAALHVSIDELLGFTPDVLGFHLSHCNIPGLMSAVVSNNTVTINISNGKSIEMSIPKYIATMNSIEMQADLDIQNTKAIAREHIILKHFLAQTEDLPPTPEE